MLDHSYKENRIIFITNYKVENGLIHIEYANGVNSIVPDTGKNRMIINQKMKSQVEEALNKYDLKALSLVFGVSIFVVIIVLNLMSKQNLISNNQLYTIEGVLGISGIYAITDYLVKSKKSKELKKLKYFIENRDKLNESIKKENISIGLNTKKQAYIESKEGEVFDFSSIDKFSYKDIQNIDENIKREEALNFDYSTLKKSI